MKKRDDEWIREVEKYMDDMKPIMRGRSDKFHAIGLHDFLTSAEGQKLIEKRGQEIKNVAERRKRATKRKREYSNEHYASLQVFIDKELVKEFKEKVKELDISQSEVIKGMLHKFLRDENIYK